MAGARPPRAPCERGTIRRTQASTDVWLPAAYLYRLFGLWGAAAAFAVMVGLGAALLVDALRQRRRLTATVDRAALDRTRRAMEAGTPRFVRGTDAGGRLPVSTIVLGVLLVALLIGAVVAVGLGLIR